MPGRPPELVVLSGLPGTGKSTLARSLAERLIAAGRPAVWLRVDTMERALAASVLSVRSAADAGYLVAQAVARENLCIGVSVVADSVNPWPLTRNAWAAAAAGTGARVTEVEVTCSDTAEHRARVTARHARGEGPDWAQVAGRDYRQWTRAVLRLDTAGLPPAALPAPLLRAVGLR